VTDPGYAAWAKKHAAASAKLEGRELPEGYVRSAAVEEFLELRAAGGWCAPGEVTYGPDAV
jgi:hypothetical protein